MPATWDSTIELLADAYRAVSLLLHSCALWAIRAASRSVRVVTDSFDTSVRVERLP